MNLIKTLEKEQAEKVWLWYTVQKKSTDDLGVDRCPWKKS